MDPSSANGASELLRDLSAKLAQGANVLGCGSPLASMKSLDNDILASLAMLRRHINSLQSPIYRLPPDVFSEIASHLQPKTDLIRLTLVSYRLRAALLSQPSLWSCIDIKHEERARAFYDRSKQAPLRLNIVKDADRGFSPLYSCRERVVSLEVCDCAAQKRSVFSQPMPALRRLKIVGNDHKDRENYDEDDYWGMSAWERTESETSWSLPSVTTLIVHDVNSISLRVPHLTRFKFRDNEDLTTIDEILDFLDGCPLLEDLDISYVNEISSSRNRLVSLPNLRTYTQSMYDTYYALTLFDTLSLPPFCSVTTTCSASEDSNIKATDIVPPFGNPDHLAEITRIKLRATRTPIGGITGALELVNVKGTKVCSERTVYPRASFSDSRREDGIHDNLNFAHLRCLQGLDARSAEILCLQGYRLWGGEGKAVDTVKYALGRLRGITTLILSGTTVKPCLLALDMDPGASGHLQRSSPVHTLIIHSEFKNTGWNDYLRTLLTVAQRRKTAGSPLKSVSLFLLEDPRMEQVLEELEGCVERFEVTIGEHVLGWDVDRYFLDGLEHLQERRNVQWD